MSCILISYAGRLIPCQIENFWKNRCTRKNQVQNLYIQAVKVRFLWKAIWDPQFMTYVFCCFNPDRPRIRSWWPHDRNHDRLTKKSWPSPAWQLYTGTTQVITHPSKVINHCQVNYLHDYNRIRSRCQSYLTIIARSGCKTWLLTIMTAHGFQPSPGKDFNPDSARISMIAILTW